MKIKGNLPKIGIIWAIIAILKTMQCEQLCVIPTPYMYVDCFISACFWYFLYWLIFKKVFGTGGK